MSTPTENPNASDTQIFDPFPKTNTMPSGWDLSALTSEPQPAPAAPVDESPES